MRVNFLFLLIAAQLFSSAHAGPSGKNLDQNTYEAVTGESADEDKSFWDTFYKQKDNAFGKDAVGSLRENINKVPKGKAFVPAMGEGRNALFLAKHGFEVTGNDISEIAVDKTMVMAKKHHLNIKSSVVDLKQYKFVENQFDFVFISLFYDRALMPGFKKILKKGGYIMLYVEVFEGNPKAAPSLFYVKHNELTDVLKDFKIVVSKEYMDQGKKVAGILALIVS